MTPIEESRQEDQEEVSLMFPPLMETPQDTTEFISTLAAGVQSGNQIESRTDSRESVSPLVFNAPQGHTSTNPALNPIHVTVDMVQAPPGYLEASDGLSSVRGGRRGFLNSTDGDSQSRCSLDTNSSEESGTDEGMGRNETPLKQRQSASNISLGSLDGDSKSAGSLDINSPEESGTEEGMGRNETLLKQRQSVSSISLGSLEEDLKSPGSLDINSPKENGTEDGMGRNETPLKQPQPVSSRSVSSISLMSLSPSKLSLDDVSVSSVTVPKVAVTPGSQPVEDECSTWGAEAGCVIGLGE